MRHWIFILLCLPFTTVVQAGDGSGIKLLIKRCADFELTGDGASIQWQKAEWIPMTKRSAGPLDYKTQFKILYSDAGIYVLFDCEDRKISTSYTEDMSDMYRGDILEVFFWTDERYPLYFEYEINALEKELVLIIPNIDGAFMGWVPWHYEGLRKTRKAVKIQGGEMLPGASIDGWQAEVFFPYDLLKPLANVPPEPGMTWKANFYRMDYDSEERESWTWTPIEKTFHDFKKYQEIVFE